MSLSTYDIIVIGAGHAGCEAALASARMGCKTAVITINADTIGAMSCNPAIGGLAKGHLVKEIDALGGEMAKNIDATAIQFRRLNMSKGPAVWSSRAQADRLLYRLRMKSLLENQENLDIRQERAHQTFSLRLYFLQKDRLRLNLILNQVSFHFFARQRELVPQWKHRRP